MMADLWRQAFIAKLPLDPSISALPIISGILELTETRCDMDKIAIIGKMNLVETKVGSLERMKRKEVEG
jgi:hypothetical protein